MNKFVYLNTKISDLEENIIGIVRKEESEKIFVEFIKPNKKVLLNRKHLTDFNPMKTGDQYDKKVCNVCHKLLNVDEYAKNQNGKNNRTVRRPSCNSCRVHIDGVSVSSKDKKLWNQKKIELEIFTCPICNKTTIPGLTSKIVLDHNHKDGKVNGWICDSCNTGLGRFRDDIQLLETAIKYLKESQD